MFTKLFWRGLLGLIIIISAGGCTAIFDSKTEDSYSGAASNGPVLSFYVGDSEFTGSIDKQIIETYKKGITLRDLLKNSGLVVFDRNGKSIDFVSNVSLDSMLQWEIQVGGKPLGAADWDKVVAKSDHIGLVAKPKDSLQSVDSLVLYLDGANDHPELTHSYVLPYKADSSVRSFLNKSGYVQLSEDSTSILSVNKYTPLTDEVWKIKVNGKLLMENGMDMKLHPQDEVEVVLTSR